MEPNIDIEFYKVFCIVAETGSFSKAAEKLYISQPAITQTIKKLEEQLDGKLFYRNNNGVTLTEEGKHLFNYIEDSIEVITNATNKFKQYKNLEEGIVRIRTGRNNAEKILYQPLIKFSKQYPNIKVEISSGNPEDSLKLLSIGKIDIVILDIDHYNKYNNINFREVAKNEYIFVMSKEYAKNNNVDIKKIKDIGRYSLILPKDSTTARKIFDKCIENEKINSQYEMISERMRVQMAKENLGIAFVMKSLVEEELESGKLVELQLSETNIISHIGLATLKDEISSYATKKLVEYIIEFNK